jgi:hypothetical protein
VKTLGHFLPVNLKGVLPRMKGVKNGGKCGMTGRLWEKKNVT